MTTGSLTDALLESCDRFADQPAVSYVGARRPGRGTFLTYGEVGQRIRRTAAALHDVGFGAGHRMLFSIRPAPDSMILLAGALAAGGSIVFADPGMSPDLFDARVRAAAPTHAAAESLIHAATSRGPIGALARGRGLTLPRLADLPVTQIYSGPRLPGVPHDAISLRHLGRRRHQVTRCAASSPTVDDEALVVFTSGTTAQPRGVVHTQATLLAGFGAAVAALGVERGSVVLSDQAMIGLPVLLAGATWMMPRLGLSTHAGPATLGRILQRHNHITHVFVVPGEVPAILDAVAARPGSLRTLLCGGAPVTAGLVRSVADTWPGVDVASIYGMTEIVPIAVASGTDKLDWTGPGDPLGRLVDGVHARIAEGELIVRGPGLCAGLLSPVDGTVTPLHEAATGDLAVDVGGRLALTGRSKDMIIRGTTNIYPGLYEPALSLLDGVRECAIVGVGGGDTSMQATGDPEVILAVVADGPAEAVRARVERAAETLIDHAARPDRIVFVDAIPRRGRTRKPDRPALARALDGAVSDPR